MSRVILSHYFHLVDEDGKQMHRMVEVETDAEGKPLQLYVDGDPISATMSPIDVISKMIGGMTLHRRSIRRVAEMAELDEMSLAKAAKELKMEFGA
jgi:hypothetical protein